MAVQPDRRWVALIAATVLGLGSFGAACGGDDETTSESTTVTSEATTTTVTATTTTVTATTTTTTATTTTDAPITTTDATTTTSDAPAEMTLVNVYWGWSVLNPAPGSPERIGAGAREVPADAPVRNGLEAMFAGLNSVEQTIGMGTSIPPGTSVLGIAIDGNTATVDLSSEFESPSGSLDETMRLAQVVFAVTQFDGIDRVKFHLDGVAQDPILSHGFEVGDGFTRDDFASVRPSILIEQPYPGAGVANPVVIRGESNTFEANVRYAITSGGGDGLVVTEGFTTATGGNGTWGSFEVIVDLADFPSDYQSGPGSIIAWEDSPRDGSQLNIVEVPIILPEL
jgi:spore germination protein GerM